jgi:BlaR1 peptidase M56
MFYLLCFCVVLAVMIVAYGLATVVMLPALRIMARLVRRVGAGTAAHLLFAFRTFPLVLSVVASLGLALPAFLEFEPHATHEDPGPALLLLGALGLLITLAAMLRCGRMLRLTVSLERKWLNNARPLMIAGNRIPVYCVDDSGSLVAVVGIFKPRIFVSRDVVDLLSAEELNAALSHELAHVRTGDNLRLFLLKITRAPKLLRSLSEIDSLWASTSEVAADECAIAQGTSALDLSSALVKVGRLSFHRPPALLAASHLVDNCTSSTYMRTERLRDLLNGNSLPQVRHRNYRWLLCSAAAVLLYLFALGTILPAVHESLEFFVRY